MSNLSDKDTSGWLLDKKKLPFCDVNHRFRRKPWTVFALWRCASCFNMVKTLEIYLRMTWVALQVAMNTSPHLSLTTVLPSIHTILPAMLGSDLFHIQHGLPTPT